MSPSGKTAADLAERLLAGDKRALARAITLVENDDPEGWALVREVYPKTGRAAVTGFTGPPGAGKSTLIGRLIEHARAAGREVAVLSIDPSSPFTQGALLGDRIRLSEHFLDPGVFIRSMANRGALGGLSEAALQAGGMEIPDVIVVNKADHPLTDTMLREIRGVLHLGPQADWDIPVLTTEAAHGKGVGELAGGRGAGRPPPP